MLISFFEHSFHRNRAFTRNAIKSVADVTSLVLFSPIAS